MCRGSQRGRGGSPRSHPTDSLPTASPSQGADRDQLSATESSASDDDIQREDGPWGPAGGPETRPASRAGKRTAGARPDPLGTQARMRRASQTPGKWAGTASDQAGTPGATATTPGTQPGSPGTQVTTPGTQPGPPGTQPMAPGTQPGSPGTLGTQPAPPVVPRRSGWGSAGPPQRSTPRSDRPLRSHPRCHGDRAG